MNKLHYLIANSASDIVLTDLAPHFCALINVARTCSVINIKTAIKVNRYVNYCLAEIAGSP